MKRLAIIVLLTAPAAAVAEVKSVSDTAFEIVLVETIARPPEEIYAALKAPAKWWSSDHSWSGDAANMWMDAQAGGCFCEKLPEKGSVEHGRIIFAQPGKQLRIFGLLGPLQSEAASGVLTWTLEAAEGGTKVTKSYVVSGHLRMGARTVAPAVDQVLAQQLAGLKKYAETPAG